MIKNKITTAILAAVGLTLTAQSAFAATTDYQPRDLILGMREAGGTQNLEVNLGNASLYYGASSAFSIPGLTLADINSAFGNINSVIWSVGGDVRAPGEPGDVIPSGTLWVTRERTAIDTKSTSWNRQAVGSQNNTAGRITNIGTGFDNRTSTANSDTAAIIPTGTPNDYTSQIGTGNYGGTFQGNVENTTPAAFASGVERSDLYELRPGTGAGTHLGYFELSSAGELSFVPVPEPSTYGLLAGAGLLIMTVRHQLRRRQA